MQVVATDKQALEAFQTEILPGVSRTFALTIPQLPDPLAQAVTNAYLLCRIADTIEDDAELPAPQKVTLLEQFNEVVAGGVSATDFAQTLYPLLSSQTPETELNLIKHLAKVVQYTHSLNDNQRHALQRCVAIMAPGMHRFSEAASIKGLNSQDDLDRYCYYVAGVVGEMLTELFCDFSTEINQRRTQLFALSRSFGQGLQMTNIIKDNWEDRDRGVCWLPQESFPESVCLANVNREMDLKDFAIGIEKLVSIAHSHLSHALDYTLLIPKKETGIRRFCLWAIGLAVLTLQNIYRKPTFTSGEMVKVSRQTVKTVIMLTNGCGKNDTLLRGLFNRAAKGLPKTEIELKQIEEHTEWTAPPSNV